MDSDIDNSSAPLHTICLWGNQLLNWDGGRRQLWLCAASLKAAQPSLKIHIVYPVRSRARIFLGVLKRAFLHVVRNRGFPHRVVLTKSDPDAVQMASDGLLGIEFHSYRSGRRAFARKLKELGCQAVFCASESLGRSFPVPWVGYIADMQHVHLPQFFRQDTLAVRDARFRAMVLEAPVLSANAQATASDIREFCPESACPIFVLPFAPVLGPDWFDADLSAIGRKYRLPERFFLISNRFWVHKSHATAFEALNQLHAAAGYDDVELICTGDTHDTRWPDHFAALQNRLEQLGLTAKVRILGRIARQDQIGLMRLAQAVVQPSLSEGGPGGFAVYEALAVGTRAIVADIAVNREIDDPAVRFFRTGSHTDLARAMREILQEPFQRPTTHELQRRSEDARQAVGAQILRAIEASRRAILARPPAKA